MSDLTEQHLQKSAPAYIVFGDDPTIDDDVFLCDELTDALDHKAKCGGTIYEKWGLTAAKQALFER